MSILRNEDTTDLANFISSYSRESYWTCGKKRWINILNLLVCLKIVNLVSARVAPSWVPLALLMDILNSFESKNYAWDTFCDLGKTFNCFDYDIFLRKFEHQGIHSPAQHFCMSYLQNRRHAVCVDGEWSSSLGVDCGVSLGWVLGPILFLVVINDVLACSYLQRIMNETTSYVKEWVSANSFLLYESKTKSVTFGLRPVTDQTMVHTVHHDKF